MWLVELRARRPFVLKDSGIPSRPFFCFRPGFSYFYFADRPAHNKRVSRHPVLFPFNRPQTPNSFFYFFFHYFIFIIRFYQYWPQAVIHGKFLAPYLAVPSHLDLASILLRHVNASIPPSWQYKYLSPIAFSTLPISRSSLTSLSPRPSRFIRAHTCDIKPHQLLSPYYVALVAASVCSLEIVTRQD